MGSYLLAHDLGTSGDKASLFSTDGKLMKSHTESYDVAFFGNHCAEQNPEEWWQAVCKATKIVTEGIDPEEVLALSFSGQMQSCILVDEKGQLVRPAIIWADQRAVTQAEQLAETVGFDRMYELTGHRVSASYSIEKLMWVKEQEPENYARAHRMLLAKDYIIYKLTGKFVTDYSDASGTNALDIKNRCWSEEIITAAGVRQDLFPEIHESVDIIGYLTEEAAKSMGLSCATAVVTGGGDGPCSALGAGCINENQLFLTYGTSSWIGGTTKEVFLDKEKVLFCFAHVIPGLYMPCGTMQAAGSSYAYIKDTLCEQEITEAKQEGVSVYELMNRLVEQSPVGAKGLQFLPYMLGERSPRWNPNTTGAYLGIRMEHTKADYLRSVLEGVALNLGLIYDAYKEQMSVQEMVLTGGGAKGDTLAQILADVLGVSLERPDHVESATSIAAAMIAGVGIGVFGDFSKISQFLKIEDIVKPRKENRKIYDQKKRVFDQAYTCMLPLYNMMVQDI